MLSIVFQSRVTPNFSLLLISAYHLPSQMCGSRPTNLDTRILQNLPSMMTTLYMSMRLIRLILGRDSSFIDFGVVCIRGICISKCATASCDCNIKYQNFQKLNTNVTIGQIFITLAFTPTLNYFHTNIWGVALRSSGRET